MLAQLASLQNKKASTLIASAQNPASIHLQRKSVFRGGADIYDAEANAAIQAPYVSSLSDVIKSLSNTGSTAPSKDPPSISLRPTKPSSTEKPKEGNLTKEVKSEVAEESPKKTVEPAKESGEKTATPEKAQPPEPSAAKGEQSPATPDEDPAFQAVADNVQKVKKQQVQHEPTGSKVRQAQAAARGPPNEVESQAKGAQVEKMDAQEPAQFDKGAFKAALLEKIASITPHNLEEADEFKENNKASSIKGSVASNVKKGKESAQGSIEQTSKEDPNARLATPKEHTELTPAEIGPAPPDIGAKQAAPKAKTDSEVSLQEGSRSLDIQMTEADISDEQLANSNEPQFQDALRAKNDAQQHSREAPPAYRQDEQAILTASQEQAGGLAQVQMLAMHNARQGQFSRVTSEQKAAISVDEQKRAEIATHIETTYATTKKKVEARLSELDEQVNAVFDSGFEQATREFEDYVSSHMSAYKEERYSGVLGKLDWLGDKLFGLPREVNVFYEEGRRKYIEKMDGVIDSVATIVETGLKETKVIISAGRQEVKTYVQNLPKALQAVGKTAAAKIESRFDELDQSLDEKKNQLVDSLAQKYLEDLKKVNERINQMKEENKGLVDKAKDAVVGAIKTILQLKDMLFGVLAKAAAVVSKIIRDPIGFLGNLVKGVKAGLDNFVGKIGEYLQKGLAEWLFGALAQAGVQVPESLDGKGILSIALQVLGLTYGAIRSIAVKKFGETVVKRLEQASEIFVVLISEGPAGLWKYILEKLGDLKDTVIDGIKGFVKQKIITAGIAWIVSLLNPASAFIKAAMMIYKIIEFIVTRGSQIVSFVDAILDSIGSIVEGNISVAASAVEKALGKSVPVVIGVLASLLGLGGISETIRGVIMKVQGKVHQGVEWVLDKAIGLAKAAGMFLFGGKEEERREGPEEGDPAKAAKIEAGLAALEQEEQSLFADQEIAEEDAQKVANRVTEEHPVFKSIVAVAGDGDTWSYKYEASPPRTKRGNKKRKDAARRELRGEMEDAMPGEIKEDGRWQAHHVISLKFESHPIVKMAIKSGWNINGRSNGIMLPTSSEWIGAGKRAPHFGSHDPSYDQLVTKRLLIIQERLLDDERLRQEIKRKLKEDMIKKRKEEISRGIKREGFSEEISDLGLDKKANASMQEKSIEMLVIEINDLAYNIKAGLRQGKIKLNL